MRARKRRGRGRGGEHEEGVVGGFLHSWPVRRLSKIGAVEREGRIQATRT